MIVNIINLNHNNTRTLGPLQKKLGNEKVLSYKLKFHRIHNKKTQTTKLQEFWDPINHHGKKVEHEATLELVYS
jgi:hypothetical protein